MLDGNGPLDLKRRNALTNCLTDLLDDRCGADTQLVRECLYAIAPPELWQFYSAQGMSGSCKSSFSGRMVHIYRAVLAAVVSRTGKDKSAIMRTISEVLKTIHYRAGPDKYRRAHPEEVLRHSLGLKDDHGNLVADFTKKSLMKGKKRPSTGTIRGPPDLGDKMRTAAAVESSDKQHDEDEFDCDQTALGDESSKRSRYDSDDSDIPPTLKEVFSGIVSASL